METGVDCRLPDVRLGRKSRTLQCNSPPLYRAELLSDVFNPGTETQEALLFDEADIPWDEIAFRTVKDTLERFFADRRAGAFGFHAFDI